MRMSTTWVWCTDCGYAAVLGAALECGRAERFRFRAGSTCEPQPASDPRPQDDQLHAQYLRQSVSIRRQLVTPARLMAWCGISNCDTGSNSTTAANLSPTMSSTPFK